MYPSEMLDQYWLDFAKWRSNLIRVKENRVKPDPMPVPDPLIAPLVEKEFRHRGKLSEIWTKINTQSPGFQKHW